MHGQNIHPGAFYCQPAVPACSLKGFVFYIFRTEPSLEFNVPQVSIIVPVYNVEVGYLKEMASSLSSQTLTDAEFLLVLDGDNDVLEQQCQEFSRQDKRFVVFKKEHGGVSDTRNFGMMHSQGEYLSFVDADDWISPDVYSNAYRLAKENDSDIVFWDMAKVSPDGTEKKEAYEMQTVVALSDEQRTELMKQFIWVRHLKYGAAISVCCKLIKREFWAKYQFLFDKNLAIGEDRIFFYSMMQKAGTVSYLNECGYFYRQDPSSATHRYQAGGLPYLIRYLNAFDRDFFAANRALFGREAYRLLTVSWGLTYMNAQNPDSYWTRMKRLSGEVRKDYFREYMRKVECARLSLWKKIEIALLRHGITLTLWIRGLAKNC